MKLGDLQKRVIAKDLDGFTKIAENAGPSLMKFGEMDLEFLTSSDNVREKIKDRDCALPFKDVDKSLKP